eukprot:gene17622-19376_t
MTSFEPITLRKGDEKYLAEVFHKMQEWIVKKKELEESIQSLETQLEHRHPQALASIKYIHEIEADYDETTQAIEKVRIEQGRLLEERIEHEQNKKKA